MTGLYIHIPFCRHKCRYCDFPSYGGVESYIPAYTEALCREISTSPWEGLAVDTIYFGGGTPSLLTIPQIASVLQAVTQHFVVDSHAEITLEGNPDSLDGDYLKQLRRLGINRLSMGIQSFQPQLLHSLGRIHSRRQAVEAVEYAARAGFDNLSADLMYGLPGQTLQMVSDDLEQLFQLPLCHASVYSLILEQGTCLHHDVTTGAVSLPPDEQVDAMASLVHQAFDEHGFDHYEISSYARPGRRSRHNVKYWTYVPYLGFGVSAHSFDGSVRTAHIANIPQYIRDAGRQSVLAESVIIDTKRAQEDYCFLALRMRDGILYDDFARRFGVSVESEFGKVVERLMVQGLLEQTERGCRLTSLGLAYGNYVFSQFIR
jgi:oxygen-independent coproporphyrinogen-3 oxidase